MRWFSFVLLCAVLFGGCGGESDGGSGGAAGASTGGSGGTSTGGSGGTSTGGSGGTGGALTCNCPSGTVCVVWCNGLGDISKQGCVTAGPNASCADLCGTDYPWTCGFSSCNGAPVGATKCMGA